jgi:hypothetical protein
VSGKSFLENIKYSLAVVRKTPYINNTALKKNILKIERPTIRK